MSFKKMESLNLKVKLLRNEYGITQEEMAKELNISRLTYMSIEKGEREWKISEIKEVSRFFNISIESLLNESKKIQKTIKKNDPNYKFIQAILFILTEIGGKPHLTSIIINHLIYFADFKHYSKYSTNITNKDYVKDHLGPIAKSFDEIIRVLNNYGLIQEVKSGYDNVDHIRYITNKSPDITVFGGTEIYELINVIRIYGNLATKSLIEIARNDMSWKLTEKIGKVIPYDAISKHN